MPIYRVLSGPDHVTCIFAAQDDTEAEKFARQLSPSSALPGVGCVQVEHLAGGDWERVCAWRLHSPLGGPPDAAPR